MERVYTLMVSIPQAELAPLESAGSVVVVAKAAGSVVAKEREKLDAYRAELARVEAALRALKEPA